MKKVFTNSILFILIFILKSINGQLDQLDEIEQYIQSKLNKQGIDNNYDNDIFNTPTTNDNNNNNNNKKGDNGKQLSPEKCNYSQLEFLKDFSYNITEQGVINATGLTDTVIVNDIDLDMIQCSSFKIIFNNMFFLKINGIKATNQVFQGSINSPSSRRVNQQLFYFKNVNKVQLENVDFYNVTLNNVIIFEIDQNVKYFGLSSVQMRYISTDQLFLQAKKFEIIKIENITFQNIKQNEYMRIFYLQSGTGVELVDVFMNGRQDISLEGFFCFIDIKNVKIENLKLENVFLIMSMEYYTSKIEINDFPSVFRFFGISYLRINKFRITDCQIAHSFLMMNINPFAFYDSQNAMKGQSQKNNIEFDQIYFDNIKINYDKEYIEEMIYLRKSQINHGFINILSSNYENGQESLIDLKLNNAVFKDIQKARMNDNDAGGIFNFMNYKNIQLVNITVENCHSPNAIIKIMKGDIIVIKDSKLINNSVSYQGGGIVHIKVSNNIIIRQTKFINNQSTEGGAIHSEFIGYFKVQDSLFQDNVARLGNGGAINAIHVKLIYVKSTIFDSNVSVKAGGSLYIKSSHYFGCVGFSNITAINNKYEKEYNAQYGGFAFIQETHTVIVNDTHVRDFYSEITGGAFYFSEIYNMSLSGITIYNCSSSQYAGAAFLSKIGLPNLGGSTFLKPKITMQIENCKSYFGGGLFIQNDDINLDLSNITFINNFGKIEGHDSIQNFQSLVVQKIQESNSDLLNSHKNVPFQRSMSDWSVEIKDFRSGSKVLFEFHIFALQIDDINTKISINPNPEHKGYEDVKNGSYEIIDENNWESQSKSQQSQIRNQSRKNRDISDFLQIQKVDENDASHYISLLQEVDLQSKFFAYSSYFIKGNDKRRLKFSLKMRYPYYQDQIFDDNFNVQVNIQFRDCKEGEFRMNYQAEICYQCPYSTYSFEKPTDMTTCKNKPNGVNSSYGNYWNLEKGFWRSESKPEVLVECSNLKENCKGGDQFDNFLCSEGHIGPLCEECDSSRQFWNETYAKTGLFSCTKCKDIKNNKLIILGVCLALLSLLIIILFSTYKKVTNNIYRYYLTKMKICYIGSSYYKMTLSTAYLKIFLNFLQTIQMSQLIRFKDFRDILVVSNIVGQPLQTVFFSVDCWLSEYMSSKKELIETKILFVILAPFIFVIVISGISFLINKFNKKININKIKYITNTVIIYGLINIFSINCFRILVNTLFCREIGQKLYLKIDLTIQCDDNQELVQRQLFLYFPSCVLWTFLVPSIIFYGLFKQRSRLNNIAVRYKYGFLYNEYKNEYFYWDFIRMAKNIVLLIIANQYQSNSMWIFSIISIVITQLYTVCLIIIRPFNTSHLNKQEFQSSVLVSITFFASLMMSLQENMNSYRLTDIDYQNKKIGSYNDNQDNLIYMIGVFVAFLICAFSVKTIFNIFTSFFERRLLFSKIMACIFNRSVSFRTFVNIKKLRKLFEGIVEFSKTENRSKYDESLKNFMIRYKNMSVSEQAKLKYQISQTPQLQNIFTQNELNNKNKENIEMSQSISLKMNNRTQKNIFSIFQKYSSSVLSEKESGINQDHNQEQKNNKNIQFAQVSYNQITQIVSSQIISSNSSDSLKAHLISYQNENQKSEN
ncbi:transmembrane protein, putative (macronuclear) [Tetrahymena thermophila SB210]|uniref:Transmembrane protein, putative n=1 Tax=Tetrahymena thermophila (strain SB210) TaxID=312017 RepID=Q22UL8_TETTS|nr:transmembrane protein, putative [Tetrahymena thermophila SB210]EAR88952.2 transmembrane protein, putative [Tetrahymena thermophila SB210]|eukprot:XP_001009197.2 transmembrane protein, putative [Tetrahymena thermophila SB210]